jgi:hypothetical protein
MYAYVGSAYAASNTVSYSPTAGNVLAITVGNSDAGGTPVASVTDNLNTTYSVAMATSTASLQQLSTFYLLNCPAGISSIAASWTGGTVGSTKEILVLEYSGLQSFLGASALYAITAPGTGSNGIVSNTVSVSAEPAALVGVVYNPSSNPCTAGTSPISFTSRFSSSGKGITAEDARILTVSTPAVTFTAQNSGNSYLASSFAFLETGAVTSSNLSMGLMGMGS